MPPANPHRPKRNADPIPKIVRAYRLHLSGDENPVPYKPFANQLSQPLEILNRVIAASTILAWECSEYPPSDVDLHALTMFARPNTWQWNFAQDIKAAKYPGIHPPTGVIGKRILSGVVPPTDPGVYKPIPFSNPPYSVPRKEAKNDTQR
jgi:hypothetical protein